MRILVALLSLLFLPSLLVAESLDRQLSREADEVLNHFTSGNEAETRELTVDQAVELAMQNNVNLNNGLLDLKYKQFAKDSSWNVFLPTLNASLGFTRSNAEIVTTQPAVKTNKESHHWSMNMGLNMQFMIAPSAFRQMYQAFIDYDTQKITFEKLRKQTQRDVSKMFYQILALEQTFSNLEMQIKNADDRFEQARVNYRNGLVNDLTVLQAQVSFESLKPNLEIAKTDYEVLLMNLKTLLGLPLEQPVKLMGDIAVDYISLDEENLIRAVAQTVEMQEMALGLKSLDNSMKTQVDALFPAFTMGFNWGPATKNAQGIVHPFSDGSWDKEKLDWGAGALTLGLSWNVDSLLPWSKSGVSRYQTKVESQKLRNNYSYALKNSIFDLKSKITKLRAYASTIEARKFALDLANRSYEQLNRSYRAGTIELLDVQDAAVKVSGAEVDLLNAQISYVDTILELEYTMGSSLKEFYTPEPVVEPINTESTETASDAVAE